VLLGKREFNSLVNLLLLPTGLMVVITGVVAELYDINDFVLHKYPAFALAGLLGAHVLLRLRQWWSSVRMLASAPARRAAAPPTHSTKPRSSAQGITRREVLSLTLGALGGFLIGDFLASFRKSPLPFDGDINDAYHQWSKPGYASLLNIVLNWGTQPPLYKEYPDVQALALPRAQPRAGMTVEDAIARRRSVRDYANGALTLDDLARLLHHSVGITDTRWGSALRAAPSAGAQYPLETYAIVHSVEEMIAGVYHYNVRDHSLEPLRRGDFRQPLIDYGLGQEFLGRANVVLILTAIFQRTRWRYQERTYRYVAMEAGHIAQNVYLMGTAMGLGVCAAGAFWDDDVNRLLGVDGKQEAALYLLSVGRV
jgi:SagB-type dehydrogenase family enzyme